MIDPTPLLQPFARRRVARLAQLDPAAAQKRALHALLRRAAETRFGRTHAFATIGDVATYQQRVGLRSYESFWEDWWSAEFPVLRDVTWPGRVPFFAQSSGTTSGASKFVPVTRAALASHRRAAFDVLLHHLAARPGSRALGGFSFVLGGSTNLTMRAPGVRSGDLSGIAAVTAPRWTRRRIFPPPEIALLPDWDRKVAAMIDGARGLDIRVLAGTPSWVLLLLEAMLASAPGAQLRQLWPGLELFVHGGIAFEPYRSRFERLFAGGDVALREVYPASEGFVAYEDGASGEGLRLNFDGRLFFEFIPLGELGSARPTRHWVANIEAGIEYAIALTTDAGLWSYLLGDTVRFISRAPPRLLVTGRTAQMLSSFGEHVLVSELDEAVAAASQALGTGLVEYAVAPLIERRRHLLVVELERVLQPAERDRFAAEFDRRLAERNDDYAHYRHDGRLGPPLLRVVKAGAFEVWMRERGRLGGQNKVPRVIADAGALASLAPARDDGFSPGTP